MLACPLPTTPGNLGPPKICRTGRDIEGAQKLGKITLWVFMSLVLVFALTALHTPLVVSPRLAVLLMTLITVAKNFHLSPVAPHTTPSASSTPS